jgi:diketogulonate reductase-like aldo/keto reductase
VETFEKVRSAGKIKRWGVSNFDLDDMKELLAIENGRNCAANQVLYNLENREIEFDLLPFLTSNIKSADGRIDRGEPQTSYIPTMAYSPVGHGRGLLDNATLKKIVNRHAASTAQIALAWVLRQPGVITIPKASDKTHVRENAHSIDIKLTKEDFADVDRAFPPPKSKHPLAVL